MHGLRSKMWQSGLRQKGYNYIVYKYSEKIGKCQTFEMYLQFIECSPFSSYNLFAFREREVTLKIYQLVVLVVM